MIFEALQFELFIFKFHWMSPKIQKIQDFNLGFEVGAQFLKRRALEQNQLFSLSAYQTHLVTYHFRNDVNRTWGLTTVYINHDKVRTWYLWKWFQSWIYMYHSYLNLTLIGKNEYALHFMWSWKINFGEVRSDPSSRSPFFLHLCILKHHQH